MRFTLGFQKVEFDDSAYKRDVKRVLEEVTLEALRAALVEIVKRIPVYTGEARGTLRPIGRFVGEQIPIAPIAKRKGHTPATGEKQASCELSNETGLNPTVRIDVELFHVRWNEANESPVSKSAPWHAFEAGRKAYIDYVGKNLKQRLPDITKYLTKTKLKGLP